MKVITVTFPENYSGRTRAGKEATFDITVKVSKSRVIWKSMTRRRSLGLESLDKLRDIVRSQIESQFGSITRQKVKRQLLDQLTRPTRSTRRRSWSRPNSIISGSR
jgi:trigger factor